MILQDLFTAAAHPLPPIDDPKFATHFDRFGDYPIVLLGDGTHGTSEFYTARAEITKRLIECHGVTVVAIEADWPDAEAIDRYVRRRPGPNAMGGQTFEPFSRFPTWMWRNREMQELVDWMRDHNARVPDEKKVGFYGLDMYSMGASMHAVIRYLDRVDPQAAQDARQRYSCLSPWVDDPTAYGLATLHGMRDCEAGVVAMLRDLLSHRLQYIAQDVHDGEEYHSTEQNAHLVRDAELYYKVMYYGSAISWTLRDSHMVDTLRRLLRSKPSSTKAVVWAHNSHCGDARFTSMGRHRQEANLGQLCREQFGRDNVALVGCGTHTGTVAAAHNWDSDMKVMSVQPSRADSWERLAHDTGLPSFLLDLRPGQLDAKLAAAMADQAPQRLQRFIGVIYRPQTEKRSHYSQANLQDQFDAYIWFDQTEAVHSLQKIQPRTPRGLEETYPFGE
ncbi:hypothetical protein EYZ11_004233 [Aspergillus tanneri]|uniref:Erythromycin esterase n=1 Tax=Aspergillus tanneri TaxID=1220188 RepID=A0A4S3JLE0_9EURO|nr:uncharacterized protein ATNIH1004_004608 [Aspergillus tanneri]KAA8648723.1 hypothetical protein ATNIH1004_004608 [Aspergillus tanneri]THC96283.1 hypothetical protein EYZ11_004233 [Aspergillus tanneri]